MRVAAEVLDKKYTLRGPNSVEVDLRPQESITGLEFQLEKSEKPIIFVTMN